MSSGECWVVVPERRDYSDAEAVSELCLPAVGRRPAKLMIGRLEWLALPGLGVDHIHAKVDTGAFSSSLHAERVELFEREGAARVRFVTHNYHGEEIACEALVDRRKRVKSSTGRSRRRIFIRTLVRTPGGMEWVMRLSLADRSVMRCPMLLGRNALTGRFVVDPSTANALGKMPR